MEILTEVPTIETNGDALATLKESGRLLRDQRKHNRQMARLSRRLQRGNYRMHVRVLRLRVRLAVAMAQGGKLTK